MWAGNLPKMGNFNVLLLIMQKQIHWEGGGSTSASKRPWPARACLFPLPSPRDQRKWRRSGEAVGRLPGR